MQGGAMASPTTSLFSNPHKESRSLYCLLATSLVSVLFVLSFSSSPSSSSTSYRSRPITDPSPSSGAFSSVLLPPSPPSLAYFISGSDGDGDRIIRLLSAVYHPRNLYLLHLDLTAPQDQRRRLALAVRSVPAFRSRGNVYVVGKADFANPRGSSALAAVLHGAAMLLRLRSDWDWFVNLDAGDYPLVTQDDLLHILSFLPKDINFVQHSSHIGWRVFRKIKPIIVDPGLYLSSNRDVVYATQKRDLPNAYRLFSGPTGAARTRWGPHRAPGGSPTGALVGPAFPVGLPPVLCFILWQKRKKYMTEINAYPMGSVSGGLRLRWASSPMGQNPSGMSTPLLNPYKRGPKAPRRGGSASVILSRKFVDFCILGVDNLPRTLLMYYANTPSSHTNYFQTVLCNSIQFNGSIVNHNLHYISWDDPPKRDPRVLSLTDFYNMTQSGVAFATRFLNNSPILDQIDRELLNRGPGRLVPGAWCLGADGDPCSVGVDAEILRPGPGAKRLENVVVQLLANISFCSDQFDGHAILPLQQLFWQMKTAFTATSMADEP
ncbi:hypothetical protein Taro_036356, partial [Colocasia esculenta]|nr:hypothetical protein [Colocasia esculenta]